MDRKKKLETSLEGLFSRSKGGDEEKHEEKNSTPVKKDKETSIPQGKKASQASAAAAKETNSTPKKKVEAEPKQAAETIDIKAENKNEPAPENITSEAKTENNPLKQNAESIAKSEVPLVKPIFDKTIPQPNKVEQSLVTAPENDLLVQVKASEGDIQLLVFEINNVNYAIEVGLVQTIIKPQAVFLVPGTPDYLKGLINLRGDVVPVINLRTRFDLPEQEVQKDTRFMVVKINDILASLVVDKVNGVKTIPLNVIEKPSGLVLDINNRYLTGIARFDGLIILILDLIQTISPKLVEVR